MASRYYGLQRGENEFDITESSSTTSKKIELVVDLTGNFDKNDILLALDKFSDYLISHIWPPA